MRIQPGHERYIVRLYARWGRGNTFISPDTVFASKQVVRVVFSAQNFCAMSIAIFYTP